LTFEAKSAFVICISFGAYRVFTLRLILPEYHRICVGGSSFSSLFILIILYISYRIFAIFVIIYFFHLTRLRQLVTSKADRKFRSPVIDCGCENVPWKKHFRNSGGQWMSCQTNPLWYRLCVQFWQFKILFCCVECKNNKRHNIGWECSSKKKGFLNRSSSLKWARNNIIISDDRLLKTFLISFYCYYVKI